MCEYIEAALKNKRGDYACVEIFRNAKLRFFHVL